MLIARAPRWYQSPIMKQGLVALVAIVVVGGILLYRNMKNASDASIDESGVGTQTTTSVVTPVSDTGTLPSPSATVPRVPRPAPTPSVAYQKALATYGDEGTGYRIQFSDCSGTPGTLTMKKGTKFMVDNRDDQSRSYVIAGVGFNIAPYDFTVTSVSRVGTFMITCEGGGAAQIRVVP